MDMNQYLDVFLEESNEHLENLNQRLLELEKNPADINCLNEIFRAAHTLKGMSSTMGFDDMADLTHHMENVLADLKAGIIKADTYVVDILFKCLDRLQLMVERITLGQTEKLDNKDLINLLAVIKEGKAQAQTAAIAERVVAQPDPKATDFTYNDYDITVLKEAVSQDFKTFLITVDVDPNALMKTVRAFMVFKVLEEEGEIIKSRPSAQELEEGKFDNDFALILISHADSLNLKEKVMAISEVDKVEITELDIEQIIPQAGLTVVEGKHPEDNGGQNEATPEAAKVHRGKQTVRVDIERLDNLMNLVGELVINKGRLEQIGSQQKLTDLSETIEQIDRITTDLQNVVMKVRMVPIEQVFNRFPRMVRDLSQELGKDVNFIIDGKETELDRTVIDEIGDPLVHLLRNALDHGLETPEQRELQGKNRVGMVRLSARHEGNNVLIEVEDDGRGLDRANILKSAVNKGLITEYEAESLSAEQAYGFLFRSGFSTAESITDVSGRGVGLDVVKSKIESLNGDIEIETMPGHGTKFKIRLPLTLAIIQALLTRVSDEIFAVPLSSVDETTMITREEIKLVQNQEVVLIRGNVLPLARLRNLLEVPASENTDELMYVVIVRKGDKQVGLVVDSLIGQQEIVIKSLGKLLTGIPGIGGAAILGDGGVSLILDVGTLF
ncbi:MAG: chemotaxis protein CheW [Methylocystaceae bacterium]